MCFYNWIFCGSNCFKGNISNNLTVVQQAMNCFWSKLWPYWMYTTVYQQSVLKWLLWACIHSSFLFHGVEDPLHLFIDFFLNQRSDWGTNLTYLDDDVYVHVHVFVQCFCCKGYDICFQGIVCHRTCNWLDFFLSFSVLSLLTPAASYLLNTQRTNPPCCSKPALMGLVLPWQHWIELVLLLLVNSLHKLKARRACVKVLCHDFFSSLIRS